MPSLFHPHPSRRSAAIALTVSHIGAFDALFAGMAILLACTYALVASYGLSIIVLSAAVTALTTPLACWAWRSQMRRAHLEPKLAELRRRHHNDRRRLASETAAVFKENGVSPWAGLLPSLLPAPIYLSVYEVIRGLTHRTRGSGLFSPRFLPHSSRLFHALASSATMRFWGIDLARTGAAALQLSGLSAGIFLGLVAITVGAGMYQQRLVRSALPRPSDPSKAPHRTLLFLPALFAIWGLAVPLGVTLYYASSSTVRVVQQWMIVRGHL